jgi:hypothetical protein
MLCSAPKSSEIGNCFALLANGGVDASRALHLWEGGLGRSHPLTKMTAHAAEKVVVATEQADPASAWGVIPFYNCIAVTLPNRARSKIPGSPVDAPWGDAIDHFKTVRGRARRGRQVRTWPKDPG